MMHHPRPQHPLPTREFRYDSYEPQRSQYSFSRPATSAPKSVTLPPRTPTHAQDSEMMVESPHYVHPPPSLAHSGNYGPPSTQYSPTTYQGFQSPPQSYESRPPPQSPTYALRPAQLNNVFSHIEHPPTSYGDPVDLASSDDDEGHRSRAATPHYSRRHMRTSSQPQHPYNYPAAYEYGAQESFSVGSRPQVNRGVPQAADPNPFALNRLAAAAEVEVPVGALRPVAGRQTRGRGGSESSVGSVVSNAAVVGDTIYRTDTLYDSMGARSSRQTSAQFQPQSAPAAYPHDFAHGRRPVEFQEQVPQPMAPSVESPYIPPPSPRHADEQGDHPFIYKGADWYYPLRSLRAETTASTDGDAMSLDGQDQGRRSSSRESSEDAAGRRPGKDKRPEPPSNSNGEGKKKTVMACHFCRFRKLRCDGGSPCGHCEKRDKECTYDTIIRRRGPGRKNKSAQETARVQLAQRQREEADREAKAQGPKTKSQRHGSVSVATTTPVEKRDASMQTSPQTIRYPAASSQGDRYYATSNRYLASSPSHVSSPSGHKLGSPANQHMAPSAAGVASAFSSPAEFQMQFRPPHDPPPRPQERQAFTIPFRHEQSAAPEIFPASLAHQQSQQYAPQQYGAASHEQLAYGLHTPASTAPSSFSGGSPNRQPSSDQQMYLYASSGYAQGQGYGSSRYQSDAHTDTESMYAYSEGANVMPSRYGGQLQVPAPPRSDVQASYGREAYQDEDVGHVGASRSDRGWEKTLPRMRR